MEIYLALYRAEFKQSFAARVEFWAEYIAIFASIASRHDRTVPIYEQYLSRQV